MENEEKITKSPRKLWRVSKQSWIDSARKALFSGGIDRVKIDLLARKLKVTRGSFYWHFKNRADLLNTLIEDWKENNTKPMLDAIELSGRNGDKNDFNYFCDLLMEEKKYLPKFDSAMRDWARHDKKVAQLVKEVDNTRIDALTKMFTNYGFEPNEAFIRARVTYYHQVGYYALNVQETPEEREKWGSYYDKILLE